MTSYPHELSANRVLVCGSRDWTDDWFVDVILTGIAHQDGSIGTIIEGEADGADRMAREWAERNGVPFEAYAANWEGPCLDTCTHGPRRTRRNGKKTICQAAGVYRNQRMLDSGIDLVIAFSDAPITPGTMDMVRRSTDALGTHRVWVLGHSPVITTGQLALGKS